MAKRSIPGEIKKEADQIIEGFNEKILRGSDCFYIPRYRGSYLYLNRNDAGTQSSICRLKYTGDIRIGSLPFSNRVRKHMIQTSGCFQDQNLLMVH